MTFVIEISKLSVLALLACIFIPLKLIVIGGIWGAILSWSWFVYLLIIVGK